MNKDLADIQINDLDSIDGSKLALKVNILSGEFTEWIKANASHIRRLVQQNGVILLRGLPIQGSRKLEKVLEMIFNKELLDYTYRSTPRTKMRGRIYTSSEYHPDETILLHNENAYSNKWPMNIAFFCIKKAEFGGTTPIADSRAVYDSIPIGVREEFEARNLLYVRNYGEIDLPWFEVFQTQSKTEVEAFCKKNHIQLEWKGKNGLRTKQINSACYFHPVTKEKLWFNQAHMFHTSSLREDVRKNLLNVVEYENLPRNVYYGDGSTIEDNIIHTIRNAYQENQISPGWTEGDLLLLDNMLYAHGRQPYKGSRKILTGMAGTMGIDNPELQLNENEVAK